MDAFLPGVEGWEAIYNNPGIWHFRFNGLTPEALVKGRERTYFEHFWNDFAVNETHSIPEDDRREYTAAYARPGRMRAAWAYFVSFQQAASDFARFAQTKLTMPVLSLGGERQRRRPRQAKLIATNSESIILPNTGHWLMEERPQETMETLIRFLRTPPNSVRASPLPPRRMTPAEVRANQTGSGNIGSSLLVGVSTKVLFGEPSFECSHFWQALYLANKTCEQGRGIVASPSKRQRQWQVQVDHGHDDDTFGTPPTCRSKNPSHAEAGRYQTEDCCLV